MRIAIATADCRRMATAWNAGYSLDALYDYYLQYSYVLDRDETNW